VTRSPRSLGVLATGQWRAEKSLAERQPPLLTSLTNATPAPIGLSRRSHLLLRGPLCHSCAAILTSLQARLNTDKIEVFSPTSSVDSRNPLPVVQGTPITESGPE
jgi:hypothetical protein